MKHKTSNTFGHMALVFPAYLYKAVSDYIRFFHPTPKEGGEYVFLSTGNPPRKLEYQFMRTLERFCPESELVTSKEYRRYCSTVFANSEDPNIRKEGRIPFPLKHCVVTKLTNKQS